MHRGGTSALSGAFNVLGANHGASVMAASFDNPRGYWEHSEIVEVHDALLAAFDSAWDSTAPLPADWLEHPASLAAKQTLIEICQRDFDQAGLHCIKDPRMSRLLPLWQQICVELKAACRFVVILRSPEEVAASIFARDGLSIETALHLWAQHVFDALEFVANKPHYILTYDALLARPAEVLADLVDDLQLEGTVTLNEAGLTEFLSDSLRHHTTSLKSEQPAVLALNTVYDYLGRASHVQSVEIVTLLACQVLPLLEMINLQRTNIQMLVENRVDLSDFIREDKTLLGSKLSTDLEESRRYATELLSENEKLSDYHRSMAETIIEKNQYVEDMQVRIAEKDQYVLDMENTLAEKDAVIGDLEVNYQQKESELQALRLHMQDELKKLVTLKDQEIKGLLESIEVKDEYIDSLKNHLEQEQVRVSALDREFREHMASSEAYSDSLTQALRNGTRDLDNAHQQQSQIMELISAYERKLFLMPGSLHDIRIQIQQILTEEQTSKIGEKAESSNE